MHVFNKGMALKYTYVHHACMEKLSRESTLKESVLHLLIEVSSRRSLLINEFHQPQNTSFISQVPFSAVRHSNPQLIERKTDYLKRLWCKYRKCRKDFNVWWCKMNVWGVMLQVYAPCCYKFWVYELFDSSMMHRPGGASISIRVISSKVSCLCLL